MESVMKTLILAVGICLVSQLALAQDAQYPAMMAGQGTSMSGYSFIPQQQTTTIRPDYNGGYIARDNNGNTSTIRPDYNGGYIIRDQ